MANIDTRQLHLAGMLNPGESIHARLASIFSRAISDHGLSTVAVHLDVFGRMQTGLG